MSNRVIVLWGIVVTLLCMTIFIIGKNYEKNYKYMDANKEAKIYLKEYIKEEEIKIPFMGEYEIKSELLKNKEYYKEIKINKIPCTFVAYIKNYKIFKTYNIKYTCINEIIE